MRCGVRDSRHSNPPRIAPREAIARAPPHAFASSAAHAAHHSRIGPSSSPIREWCAAWAADGANAWGGARAIASLGAIDEAHEHVFGERPGRDVPRWFSDASALSAYGVPTVNYGASTGLMEPGKGESLEIEGLVKTAEVYARVARAVCG